MYSGFKGYTDIFRETMSVQRTLGVDKFQRTTALYSVQCFVVHPVHNLNPLSGQSKNITSYILSLYTPGRPRIHTHTLL